MGQFVGTVTRNSVRDGWNAQSTDGDDLGSFEGLTDAQNAVARTASAALLRWEKTEMPSDIEHWRGFTTDFGPRDLGSRLKFWLDSDQGTEPVGAEQRVTEWNSFDGSGAEEASQSVAANAPILVPDGGPAGLDAVQFATGSANYLDTTILSLAPPFTISATCTYQPATHANPQLVVVHGGGLRLRENAGNWELDTDGGTVVGPAVVAGQATVLTVVQTATQAEFYVNGTSYGTVVWAPPAGAIDISDAADWHAGNLYDLVITDDALASILLVPLINYQRNRWGAP